MTNRVWFILSNFTSFNCGLCAYYFLCVKDSWWGMVFLLISSVMTGITYHLFDEK